MEVRKNCLEKCGYTLFKARTKPKNDKFLTKNTQFTTLSLKKLQPHV